MLRCNERGSWCRRHASCYARVPRLRTIASAYPTWYRRAIALRRRQDHARRQRRAIALPRTRSSRLGRPGDRVARIASDGPCPLDSSRLGSISGRSRIPPRASGCRSRTVSQGKSSVRLAGSGRGHGRCWRAVQRSGRSAMRDWPAPGRSRPDAATNDVMLPRLAVWPRRLPTFLVPLPRTRSSGIRTTHGRRVAQQEGRLLTVEHRASLGPDSGQ